jgi:hypothetical protein
MDDFCGVTEISASSYLWDGDPHIELLHCALTRRALRARAIILNEGVPEWTGPVPGEYGGIGRPSRHRRDEFRAEVAQWRTLLTSDTDVADARQFLRDVLDGPIQFTPPVPKGAASTERLLREAGPPPLVASPTGLPPFHAFAASGSVRIAA